MLSRKKRGDSLAVLLLVGSVAAAQDDASPGMRYIIRAASPVTLSLPLGEAQGENLYRSPSGQWAPIPQAQFRNGVLTFTLTSDQLQGGGTMLLLGKPEWLDPNDDAPPQITKATLDGQTIAPTEELRLGWLERPPRRLELMVADARNPLNPASVRAVVNGQTVGPEGKGLHFETDPRNNRRGRLVCRIPELLREQPHGLTRIRVECDDFAPDEQKTAVQLTFTVTRPPRIKLEQPAATPPNGMKIFVDSIFAGYENVACLVDGQRQPPGASTVGCSWASTESEEDHWLCLALPHPRVLSGLKIDWAHWKGTYWTSSRYDVLTWDGQRWQRALRVQDNPPGESSTHTFPERTTDRVLVWQPALGGHPDYADIFWVTEVTLLP